MTQNAKEAISTKLCANSADLGPGFHCMGVAAVVCEAGHVVFHFPHARKEWLAFEFCRKVLLKKKSNKLQGEVNEWHVLPPYDCD